MVTERWMLTKNGVTQFFQAEVEVVADFVVPCSYCGIPCTGTFRVWYLNAGKRVTFETDCGSLRELLDSVVGAAIDRGEYEYLPQFVRDWNEGTGWNSLEFNDGAVVAPDDLLATISAVEREDPNEQVSHMVSALRKLVAAAVQEASEVWVGET